MQTLACSFQVFCTPAALSNSGDATFSTCRKQNIATKYPLSSSSGNLSGRRALRRLKATDVEDPQAYVDYSSSRSVFPAEACEEVGGDACDVNMGPETKLPPRKEVPEKRPEGPDRETTSYDGPKTVFPGEACDELGGEFCEADYQEGVGKEV